jgi:hypothetical protein
VSTHPWEVHYAAGPRRYVAKKLFALPQTIVSAPLYILFVQGEQSGTIHTFQCLNENERRAIIAVWQSSSLGDLPRRALGVLSAPQRTDKADDTPRAAVSSLLAVECSFRSSAPALAPGTPRAAFGLPLDSTAGALVSACVMAL